MQAGRIQQVDAPFALYEQPRSRFISDFVGRTNLVHGTCRGGAIALAAGVQVPAPSGCADGASLTVGLRPEKLKLTPEGGGQLQGRIAERFFLGSQWLYRVDCALGALEVACPNDGRAPWAEQQAVGLDWSADVARVLAAEGA
jgi:putative spermidine/putrescine transport system ATP-binding protein